MMPFSAINDHWVINRQSIALQWLIANNQRQGRGGDSPVLPLPAIRRIWMILPCSLSEDSFASSANQAYPILLTMFIEISYFTYWHAPIDKSSHNKAVLSAMKKININKGTRS
ncbi:MAG: hypothetical protein K0A99_10710 [Desulfoarculaceae bacterium]|nr:hypothetical protein [Desulfoarculaceae bacterium]